MFDRFLNNKYFCEMSDSNFQSVGFLGNPSISLWKQVARWATRQKEVDIRDGESKLIVEKVDFDTRMLS